MGKHAAACSEDSGEVGGIEVRLGLVGTTGGTSVTLGEFNIIKSGTGVEMRGVRAGVDMSIVGHGALHSLATAHHCYATTLPPSLS